MARRLSAIRQLYRFLYAEGHAQATIPPPSSKARSADAPLPKVLAVKDVDQPARHRARGDRRRATPDGERLRAARLNALLELVYATGLRVSELVSLPVSAAERNARMLIVRGKGDKERLVPLNESRQDRDARVSGAARGGREADGRRAR